MTVDVVVSLRRSELDAAVLHATTLAKKLTAAHKSDKEMAQALGISLSTWLRMIRADAKLTVLGWVARRKGSLRPRRRWPAAEVVLYLHALGRSCVSLSELDAAILRAAVAARKTVQLSTKKLATALGISVSTWARMIRADARLATLGWARRKGIRPRRRWPYAEVVAHLQERERR